MDRVLYSHFLKTHPKSTLFPIVKVVITNGIPKNGGTERFLEFQKYGLFFEKDRFLEFQLYGIFDQYSNFMNSKNRHYFQNSDLCNSRSTSYFWNKSIYGIPIVGTICSSFPFLEFPYFTLYCPYPSPKPIGKIRFS